MDPFEKPTAPLNDGQFAKYSAVMVPHPFREYDIKPLPASMERHAPGEYQPTLPGMEKMLEGEMTSTDVFFDHPNQAETWTANDGTVWQGDVKGSDWYNKSTLYNPEDASVRIRSLRPVQDWLDDNHLHSTPDNSKYWHDGKPLVERIGRKNVLMDGHHRVARERLAGKKTIDVARWGEIGS